MVTTEVTKWTRTEILRITPPSHRIKDSVSLSPSWWSTLGSNGSTRLCLNKLIRHLLFTLCVPADLFGVLWRQCSVESFIDLHQLRQETRVRPGVGALFGTNPLQLQLKRRTGVRQKLRSARLLLWTGSRWKKPSRHAACRRSCKSTVKRFHTHHIKTTTQRLKQSLVCFVHESRVAFWILLFRLRKRETLWSLPTARAP